MIIKVIKHKELTEDNKKEIVGLMNVLSSNCSVDIERAMERDNNTCIIACENNKIVGVVMLIEVNAFTAKIGLIDEVVVNQNYRKQGIAFKMIEEAIRIAKERKIDLLKVDTRIDNPSNSLYKKVGFIKREDNLYKLFLK
ncbi:GNAT family N-acetyltransferase [Patescibacteria group bacterium]|nr:GNAT family N-acetyltransferase [Patescibacteria group bacterium]